uniref:Major facilitator superfamily (MFS) profile domain-containing protein n=1 Tax=Clastoptera arizonana TaxID=38151 RepID=A0A1B6CBK7_9HEMI
MEDSEKNSENKINHCLFNEEVEVPEFSKFKSTLAQFFAALAFGSLFLDVGMFLALPTIVIAALQNPENKSFVMTREQASWFGSIFFVAQPLGCIISGLIQDSRGRKFCMLLINLPWVAGIMLIYCSKSIIELYLAGTLIGFGIGIMEAPMFSYIGESIQPQLRGILSSMAGAMLNLGFIIEYFLGAIMNWRSAIIITSFFPVVSFLLILLIPESPIWLVSKGRVRDAEKSLCWLRGWTSPRHVQTELAASIDHLELNRKERVRKMSIMMVEYHKILPSDIVENQQVQKEISLLHRFEVFLQPQVMKPLRLIIFYFFVSHCIGLTAMRPFYVSIFNRMNLPLTAHWVTVFCGSIQLLGSITCIAALPKLGKRKLTNVSLVPMILSCASLGLYTLLKLDVKWVPLTLFGVHLFSYTLGIGRIPWILMSELFPLEAKGLGVGFCAAASYFIWFFITKTYLNLEDFLSLPGVFFLYSSIGIIGAVYFYLKLPETEGKTLHEIHLHFMR